MRLPILLAIILAIPLPVAAQARQQRDTKAALATFRSLRKKQQTKILAELRSAVDALDSEYLRNIRLLTASALHQSSTRLAR